MHKFYQEKMITKTASLYYLKHLNQKQISDKLNISQATVSRLLDKALKNKIVRVSVNSLPGLHNSLENEVINKYNLKDCVICKNSANQNEILLTELGNAAAFYLETAISNNDIIGISSWSESLLSAVTSMNHLNKLYNVKVVQTLGGTGEAKAREHSVHLLSRLTELVNGEKYYLPIPGIVAENFDTSLLNDKYLDIALKLLDKVTVALIGIGTIQKPSTLIKNSGNVFSQKEINRLKNKNAIGEMGLQYFNQEGESIKTSNKYRVMGISLNQLKKVKNSIAVAGGLDKVKAIVGALRTNVINTLVTDPTTAREILKYD